MLKFRPVFLIASITFVASALVFLAAGYESMRNLSALMAGASAYSLMAFNLILASRLPGLEPLLGGLDQIYKLHKWSGIAVLGFVIVHTQLKFIQLEGLVPPGSLAETSVEVAKPAFMVLVVLIILSAVKRIPRVTAELPWMWWRATHWLIIPIFLVLSFHQVFVKAPFDSTSAIRLWLYGVGLAGLGAIIWIILGPWLRKRSYEVVGILRLPKATKVTARPLHRPVTARAGQFAFLSVARAGLREPHPFTLSRIGDGGEVEFCIQPVGDFTHLLRETLQLGDKLRLEGGYGRFDFKHGRAQQIWLAGGIGITPFLAMAEAFAKEPGDRSVVLIHVVRETGQAIAEDRLRAIEQSQPSFTYKLHDSRNQGRLDAGKLDAYLPFPASEADLWYCGPKALRKSILDQWNERGQRPRAVHFEEFEFR